MTPQQKAKQWLENCNILDTETTGLEDEDEICEISIIDHQGNIQIDTLVKPSKPIPEDATRIHGITNEMVADAPTWPEIHDQVRKIIAARPLVIFNASYDTRILEQTARLHGLDMLDHNPPEGIAKQLIWAEHQSHCAMLAYAEFYGEWNDSKRDYKWQSLIKAAKQQNVQLEGQAHRALYDCQMTFGVIQAMANAPDPIAEGKGLSCGCYWPDENSARVYCRDHRPD